MNTILHRIRHEHELDTRLDGRSWPRSSQEIAAELAEIDALPPLLSPKEADRFDAWLVAERERQKALAKSSGTEISQLGVDLNMPLRGELKNGVGGGGLTINMPFRMDLKSP